MPSQTRRDFLKYATMAATYSCAIGAQHALATPLGLPLGLQLYSVREMLPNDYEGTLKHIGELGYKEVEAAGFYNHDPAQVKSAMDAAGLRCVSAHYSYDNLHPQLDQVIDFGKKLGLGYIICSFPGRKNPAAAQKQSFQQQVHSFTLEDWRWNAEQFNIFGEKIGAAGLKFGYHNHTMEFKPEDGVVPYEELLRLTDPKKVTFEMDCGWVIVGGGRPETYLHKYPKRFSMLHVKDFKTLPHDGSISQPPAPTELGRGVIDYKPIFAAARQAPIKHIFIEQEGFDVPPWESLEIDAQYMEAFKG